MTQGRISTKYTRPGHVIHAALTASILVYALIVELCESQFAPFEGSISEVSAGVLSELQVAFVVIGVVGLVVAFFFLWRAPHIGSVGGAFVIAYASLDVLAIFGLVLFLLGGSRSDFYRFAIPAIVGQLLLWTQAGRWDELTTHE